MQYWILPCNVKQFDVCAHFLKNQTVVWKDISHICNGDIVYIYLSAPYSKITYKCIVIDENVSKELLDLNEYAKPTKAMSSLYTIQPKYIKMKLVDKYSYPELEFKNLKQHGLGQVQVEAKISHELQLYIDSITNNEVPEL